MERRKTGLWKGRLSDDGIITELYNYFFLAAGKAPEVIGSLLSVPDTILYERGFPKAWYSWEKTTRHTNDDSDKTLRKHLGKDIASEFILKKFCAAAKQDVVAEYITLDKSQDDKLMIEVQYMNPKDLEAFLSSRAPGAVGVLQRYVPVSSIHNASFEVVWSPLTQSVTQVRSKVPVANTTEPLLDRYATFDADSTNCVNVIVQAKTRQHLLDAVSKLVHTLTMTEGTTIIGIVVHCKVDSKGGVVIQYCTSIRSRSVETAVGMRDPLLVGANYRPATVLRERQRHASDSHSPNETANIREDMQQCHSARLPGPRPHFQDNLRPLPAQSRVHVLYNEKQSSVFLGEAYMPSVRDQSQMSDTKSDDDEVKWTEAVARLEGLGPVSQSVSVAPVPPKTSHRSKSFRNRDTTGMPSDQHKDLRTELLLFLEDVAYLTRAHRERAGIRQRRESVASPHELPPYFNEGTAFHFHFPNLIARSMGPSGLNILCRELGLHRTHTLYDAHGHDSDYYSFQWAANTATNAQLTSAVMYVYPPVVVRKGRRSFSRKSVAQSGDMVEDDDDDGDEDSSVYQPSSVNAMSNTIKGISPRYVAIPNSGEGQQPPLQSPLMPDVPLVAGEPPMGSSLFNDHAFHGNATTGTTVGSSQGASSRPNAATKSVPKSVHRLVDWRIESGFPKAPVVPRRTEKKRRVPMSAEMRETNCKLSPQRKRLYYPEGQRNTAGPSISTFFRRRHDEQPTEPAPLSPAAAMYLKKRSNQQEQPEEDPLLAKMPFVQIETTREKKPQDLMMEFWTQ